MYPQYRTLPGRNSKRDRIVLIADMLQRATMEVKKTELMYHVGLSTTQFCNYVPELLKSGLIEQVYSTCGFVYRTTCKGKKFLNVFDVLFKVLHENDPNSLSAR
jgi:predicted transcriptional regulator